MGKRACHQTWQPEFNPWSLHGGRRKPTPPSCLLTSICVPYCAHSHTQTHSHTHLINQCFKRTAAGATIPRFSWPTAPAALISPLCWGQGRVRCKARMFIILRLRDALTFVRTQIMLGASCQAALRLQRTPSTLESTGSPQSKTTNYPEFKASWKPSDFRSISNLKFAD